MEIIVVNNLTKKYGKVYGIKDVNFVVNKGEIFGFVGPNGAGKSTCLRTMLNLLKKSSGEIRIFGINPEKDYDIILRDIGYLPSELFYYDNMKAINLLKYSERFYKKDCSIRRNELAKILNVDINMKICDMSFGTKKKVGIIDAMQHEPNILILDEPTTGLDPLIQKKFHELLKEEQKKGTTILYSSHVLSEVQKICDRVGILKEGKIIKIENMNEQSGYKYKKISIFTKEKLFLNNSSVTNVKTDGYNTTFLYRGNANEIIKLVSGFDMLDILIEEPDLEEIFMHYYE